MSALTAAFAESGHGGPIPKIAPSAGQHAFLGDYRRRRGGSVCLPRSAAVSLTAKPAPAAFRPPRRRGILAGMSKRPRSEVGQPMSLGNMRANGVRSLDVSCWQCHHRTILRADPWPDHVPVPSFGPRMVCTRCGIVGADARPNWKEQPPRETLTGVQWC
jgi:hypothetical protein